MKCSEPKCSRLAKVRSYCASHYTMRRRRGLPLGERRKTESGALLAFIEKHVAHRGKVCIEWPYGRGEKGYGHMYFRGRCSKASRVMCVLAHGEPPFPRAEAAHSCHNTGCVNPKHISWKTRFENAADKDARGSTYRGAQHWRSGLMPEDVLQIIVDPRPGATVAGDYGCTKSAIYAVRNGASWSWLTGIKRKAA